MSIPFLLGPVETGSSFMLVSIQNNQPNILNGAPFDNGIIYYWESNLSTIISGTNLPIFTAEGTLNSLTLTDTVNGGGMAFRSDGTTIGNASKPAQIMMNQSMFANFFPPEIFLSMAIYTISNSSGTQADVLTTNSGTGPTMSANNIIILPVLWYFNCTNTGSYQTINTPINSVINWFCLVNPSITACSGISIAKSGWTNILDCVVGNDYNYCPVNQLCGADNCKGPCSVVYNDCEYIFGTYECIFNPVEFFTETQWWESPYFIGSVVGIFVLVIIIIIIIYLISRSGSPKQSPSSYQSYYLYD